MNRCAAGKSVDLLNQSLTVGLGANELGSVIVFESTGEDFTGAGTLLVDKDDYGLVSDRNTGGDIGVLTVSRYGTDYGATFEEHIGYFKSVGEETTGIISEVDNKTIGSLEFF